MKKILLTLAAVVMCSGAFADDRPIDYNQIPKNAKTFIAKHFAGIQVASATVDPEFIGGDEYTVYMSNGSKVDFNSKGAWKEVDCGTKEVPAGIIPAKIATYIKTNYAGVLPTKIDKDKTDYEIKLSNSIELKFSLNGNFISVDN